MRRDPWLPLVPLAMVGFALLSPVILAGKTLYWGTPSLQFVPWRNLAWEALRSGQIPLWNPYLGMGAPLLANYQSGLFYPPNWLLFLLDLVGGIGWSAWGQTLLVVFHFVLAGWGMARLSGELGLKPLAQSVSGLAFGLCGYMVSRAGFLSINAAAAWLPWVLLWITRFVHSRGAGRRKRGKNFLWLSVVLTMQLLSGHAQTTWYTWLLGGIWASYLGWRTAYSHYSPSNHGEINPTPGFRWGQRLQGVGKAWVGFALAIFLACALSAVQLLPTGEYLLQSQRTGAVDFEYAMNYSFWPWHLLSLIAPDIFGNPTQGDYWGYANYWEDAIYIGLLPFIMAVFAIIKGLLSNHPFKSRSGIGAASFFSRGLIIYTLLVSLASLILALGRNTPLFPWLYEHVPTFDMFQAPARFTLWLEFGLSLLAGVGVHLWRRPEGRGLYWTRLATAGSFAISLGAGLTWILMGNVRPTFIRATALAGLWAIGTGGLSLLAPQKGIAPGGSRRGGNSRTTWWSIAVVTLVSADLLVAGWGLNPGADKGLYTQPSTNAALVEHLSPGGRLYLPPEDEQIIKYEQFFRFDTFTSQPDIENLRAALLPNINILDGISSANNFDPLIPGRYDRWMAELGARFPEIWDAEAVDEEKLPVNSVLNLMGVGVVEEMETERANGVTFTPVEQRLKAAGTGQDGKIFYWFNCMRPARDSGEALDLVFNSQFDLGKVLILENSGDPVSVQGECPSRPSQATVEVLSDSPNHYILRVDTPSSGWLLVSDVWYPGWRASVDGNNKAILRADYLFRAIQVEAGHHQVVFSYRPLSFELGAVISLVSWAAIVIVFILLYGKTESSGKI
jgi:hypothetical protein